VEAILLYIELDTPGPVLEELMPFLSHKMAKVIAATVNVLGRIYGAYGAKIVDPKPVLKALPKLFGHADKNVRAETTTLTVEMYKWLKDGMKPFFFAELKPAQQKDLDTEFEKVKGEAPKQARLLRSQQAAAEVAEAAGEDGEEAAGEEEEAEDDGGMDAYDLVDPVDVLAKMPDNFGDMIASTKWKDRKETLDELYKIINTPKIKNANYDELIRAFAKSMKDANVAVVTVASQCNEALAKGLREDYAKYRSQIMAPTLERLKEKKQNVTDALGASLDAIFASVGTPHSFLSCFIFILFFGKSRR
jgi:protein STU2